MPYDDNEDDYVDQMIDEAGGSVDGLVRRWLGYYDDDWNDRFITPVQYGAPGAFDPVIEGE